jgi:hypothetical protein
MKPSKNTFKLTQANQPANMQMFPHKIVYLDELEFTGKNLFKYNGIEMAARDGFVKKIDEMINITAEQSNMVKNISGENGLSNFKNYFSVASSAAKRRKAVLFAHPDGNMLEDIVALKNEYISFDMFSDFLEIFRNKAGYEVVKQEYDAAELHKGGTFYLNPISPTFEKIGDNEEFITDGVFFRWDVGEVETGNYFTRLACANGVVQRVNQKIAKVYSLSSGDINKLLNLAIRKTLGNGFSLYKTKVLQAIETSASLSEMMYAFKLLVNNGLQKEEADRVIPYETLHSSLKTNNVKPTRIKTSFSLWDIYNRLTDFSSHTELWEATDPRRSNIVFRSGLLLDKKPDIVNYMEI